MRRYFLLALSVLFGLATIAAAAWLIRLAQRPTFHGAAIEPRLLAADFSLMATTGQPAKLSDYRGKVVLLYFGYTFCPDVCPTTLVDVKRAFERLGPQAEDVQLLMVTVDPERDTPKKLGEYLRYFHPSFVGLTGTVDEIRRVADSFGAKFEKHEGTAATGYLVDHTARVFVIDRQGYLSLSIPFGATPDEIAADLTYFLTH